MFLTQPKIFISSTILDMPSERAAALKAVDKVGGFPFKPEFTMEAQSKDSLKVFLDIGGYTWAYCPPLTAVIKSAK